MKNTGAQDSSGKSASSGSSSGTNRVPVVGIGASAGGLEALKQFFTPMPVDTGLAFVLVQHLDPDHQSLMADLLAKYTTMPVAQVVDATEALPNHVYVIPPNHYLSIEGGVLHLEPPIERRGMRMPIDHFFRSLAQNCEEKAICVILSGTGSDGTIGLREIKGRGGMAMVQEPANAQYDGMPQSALATSLVDFRLPAGEMAQALARYVQHPYVSGAPTTSVQAVEPRDDLSAVIAIIRARTGQDFKHYKKGTLGRRVVRRMGLASIESMFDYLQYLRNSDDEVNKLVRDLLISVTSFFREPQAFSIVMNTIAPALVARAKPDEPIRIWVPGCASGEEAYSLAMVFLDAIRASGKQIGLQVFASDLDHDALEVARSGIYPLNAAGEIPPDYVQQFCTRDGEKLTINKSLREYVIFAAQNLISDPPFSRLDMISCRNLLIYLDNEVQSRLIRLFHFALREGGYLFLGNSETIGNAADMFRVISKKWRIYSRLNVPLEARNPDYYPVLGGGVSAQPTRATGNRLRTAVGRKLGEAVHEKLLEEYAPAAVLVDRTGEALFFHGPTARFLEVPTGTATHEVVAMARDGLRTALRAALQKTIREGTPHETRQVAIRGVGEQRKARIKVWPINDDQGTYLICFFDETADSHLDKAAMGEEGLVQQLEYELKATREDLQTTIEEVETTNEELKAANEEVMSMNEELQSTNEELETSKEELQSLNEELSTVNNQLLEKLHQLESANNDLANLLVGTDIATVFLDADLRIRRYTPMAVRLFALIESDCGRPIGDVMQRFKDGDLSAHCRKVIKELQPFQEEVSTGDGLWYHLRILPYRTSDNRIDGVVITFSDITGIKLALSEVQVRERQMRLVADALPVLVAKVDLEHRFQFVSAAYVGWFGKPLEEMLGEPLCEIFGNDSFGLLCRELEECVATGRIVEGEGRLRHTNQGERDVSLIWIPELDSNGKVIGIFSLIGDVTDRHRAEAELKRQRTQLQTFVAQAPIRIAMVDLETNYLAASELWQSDFGTKKGNLTEPNFGGVEQVSPRWVRAFGDALHGSPTRNQEELWTRKKGTAMWVRWAIQPWTDDHGAVGGAIVVISDISSYKQIESELLLVQGDLNRAQTVGQAGSWRCVLATNIMTWSSEGSRIIGRYPGTPFDCDDFLGLVHPEDRLAVETAMNEAKSGKSFDLEHRLHKNDRDLWVRSKGEPEYDAQGSLIGIFGIIQDIDQRRKNEEQLHVASQKLATLATERWHQMVQLSRDLSRAEEKERDRLHEVLHDHVQPLLVATRLGLSGITPKMPVEGIQQLVADANAQISKVLETARTLTVELSPPLVREEGLLSGLDALARWFQTTYGLHVAIDASPEAEPASLTIRLLCFKGIRELLLNVVKHAGAKEANVSLKCRNRDWLTITVADSGVGYDAEDDSDGSGIANIARRIGMLGGTMEVESEVGKGTTVTLVVPLALDVPRVAGGAPRRRDAAATSGK